MSDTGLFVEIGETEGIPVVQARGEIDVYTVAEFERALEEGVERATDALIVDLSNLFYIDSAGLSSLLAAHKALTRRNADLYIVAPPDRPGICRVLEITRLDSIFRVRRTVDEAVREAHLPSAA